MPDERKIALEIEDYNEENYNNDINFLGNILNQLKKEYDIYYILDNKEIISKLEKILNIEISVIKEIIEDTEFEIEKIILKYTTNYTKKTLTNPREKIINEPITAEKLSTLITSKIFSLKDELYTLKNQGVGITLSDEDRKRFAEMAKKNEDEQIKRQLEMVKEHKKRAGDII